MKALEKDRNRRYETASGFAADMEHYLHDEAGAGLSAVGCVSLPKVCSQEQARFHGYQPVTISLLLGLGVSTWLFVEEKAARQQAVSEAAKTTAINDLLQEMLASANPDGAKGADYTVRQLLDGFSEGLGGHLTNQPDVEAAIRATIGNAYVRLGLTAKAEPHLSAALELRRRAYGAESIEVAQSLFDHAWYYFESGNAGEAEAYARKARAIFKKDGAQIAKEIETLSVLQLSLNQRMKYADAEVAANEALALGRQHFPNGSRNLADVLHRLANADIVQQHPANAKRRARQSVVMHRKFHGDDHPETGWGLYHLAWALQEQQKYDEAEPLFREALAIFRKLYDDQHASTAQALDHLRGVLTAQGNQAGLARLQAESALRASELLARTKDDLLRSTLRGNLYRDSGDLDKAIAEYTAVVTVKPEMAEVWGFRADCFLRKNEFAKAVADYSEAIKLKPSPHYWHERGYVYLMLGDHQKAIDDHSLAIERHDNDAGQRMRRGASYQALGQLDKAEADYSKAIDLNPNYWEHWAVRPQLYAGQGQWEKAENDLDNAIKTCAVNKPYEKNSLAWAISTQVDPRLRKPEDASSWPKRPSRPLQTMATFGTRWAWPSIATGIGRKRSTLSRKGSAARRRQRRRLFFPGDVQMGNWAIGRGPRGTTKLWSGRTRTGRRTHNSAAFGRGERINKCL